eukprot:4831358-Prymnesium_polylepis.2
MARVATGLQRGQRTFDRSPLQVLPAWVSAGNVSAVARPDAESGPSALAGAASSTPSAGFEETVAAPEPVVSFMSVTCLVYGRHRRP